MVLAGNCKVRQSLCLQTMVEAVLILSRLAIRRVHPGFLGLRRCTSRPVWPGRC